MYVGGVHSSLDESPTTTMFQRADGVPLKRKTDPVSEALSTVASAITVAPGMARSGPSSTNQASRYSPAKTIENAI